MNDGLVTWPLRVVVFLHVSVRHSRTSSIVFAFGGPFRIRRRDTDVRGSQGTSKLHSARGYCSMDYMHGDAAGVCSISGSDMFVALRATRAQLAMA